MGGASEVVGGASSGRTVAGKTRARRGGEGLQCAAQLAPDPFSPRPLGEGSLFDTVVTAKLERSHGPVTSALGKLQQNREFKARVHRGTRPFCHGLKTKLKSRRDG